MALRAVKTDEEASATPLDQPILIELPGGTIEDEPEDKPERKAKTSKVEPSDPDAKKLQEQLEAAQAAQRTSDERAAKSERDANERVARAEREAADARKRTAALEGDVINGGLSASQSERDSAKAAFKSAFEAGDANAMADAQSRMGRAEAKILSFESGAAEIAERAETEKTQVRQEPVRQNVDVNTAIDTAGNLLPAEKTWLKAHPDAFMPGPRNNELSVGYERAMKQGLVRGTDPYFEYLEEFMGYKSNQDDRSISVQAPPSRQERGNDGRPSGNRITLSPEQREIAKSLGVSEIEYAKNVIKFEEAKRADPEKYNSRG